MRNKPKNFIKIDLMHYIYHNGHSKIRKIANNGNLNALSQ